MRQKIFLIILLLVLPITLAAHENSGFETGDLSGWKTYCYGEENRPAACQNWIAVVGKGYANTGEYGLKVEVPNNLSWSSAVLESETGFYDSDSTYTIDLLVKGTRSDDTGVIIQISDSNGSVAYAGNTFGRIKGMQYDRYFNIPKGVWWTHSFAFKEDYYSKYKREPDRKRSLKITCHQNSDYCELWIDNIFGRLLCVDKDKDGYSNCGETDCDDDDPLQYPGTTKVTDMNMPWGTTGECEVQISKCDTDGRYFVIQKKIMPKEEVCDSLDNDCDGVIDDADSDSDGVNDCTADRCPKSMLDNIQTGNYAQNLDFGPFELGSRKSLVYDMQAAKGCTCRQIGEMLGKDTSDGCSSAVMEEWTGISSKLDRNSISGAAVALPNSSGRFLKYGIYILIGIIALFVLANFLGKKKKPSQPDSPARPDTSGRQDPSEPPKHIAIWQDDKLNL